VIQAAPNSTIDQTTLYTSLVNDVYFSLPETATSFQITRGFRGLLGPRHGSLGASANVRQRKWWARFSGRRRRIPGVRVIAFTPPALPGGGNYPVEFVIASTAEPRELLEFANTLVAKAFESKLFVFADTDLKFDFPQTEIVFDKDKVASMGLNLSQVGTDLSTLLGGGYVNRFSIEGRSYKVIPQLERAQPTQRRPTAKPVRQRTRQQTRATLYVCDAQDHHGTAHHQPFSTAQQRAHPRGHPAEHHARSGPQGA
jgi:multidrug efflux pump